MVRIGPILRMNIHIDIVSWSCVQLQDHDPDVTLAPFINLSISIRLMTDASR